MDPDDFSYAPQYIYGVPDAPTPPAGSDSLPPPAQPVSDTSPDAAVNASVQSALARGAQVSAGSVWRMPVFQALLLFGVGVVLVAHASYVAAKV